MLEQYLDTLERIPDDILLSVLTRDLDLDDRNRCLCGWVLREKMAQASRKDASEVHVGTEEVPYACAKKFGGSVDEWYDIYFGVTDRRAPTIERALKLRVLEAVQ